MGCWRRVIAAHSADLRCGRCVHKTPAANPCKRQQRQHDPFADELSAAEQVLALLSFGRVLVEAVPCHLLCDLHKLATHVPVTV